MRPRDSPAVVVYEYDPQSAGDDAFVPATFERLVPGVTGRLLDPRRTPVRVLSVTPDHGLFEVEVCAFEDQGAVWRIPLEMVERFQLRPDGLLADAMAVSACYAAVARFSEKLSIPIHPGASHTSLRRLDALVEAAAMWIEEHSTFARQGGDLMSLDKTGDARLYDDVRRWLGDLAPLDQAFARAWVSNPWPAGVVEGHRIVAAEIGLCPYEGKQQREPDLFSAPWTREARASHLLRRMAFTHALYRHYGQNSALLYRGLSLSGALQAPRNGTFVSATFDKALATAHFDQRPHGLGVLTRQPVPVERLVMTFRETWAMNATFLEAEALLLYEPGNLAF